MAESTAGNGAPAWPVGMPAAFTEVPREPLLTLMVPHLHQGATRPMVIFDDGVELTCADFLDATERFAAGLARRIGPGDEVGLAIGNRAEFLVAYYAVISLRAVVVQFGPKIGDVEANHIVADRQLALAIADGPAADSLEHAAGGRLTVLRVDTTIPEPHGLQRHYGSSPRHLADPEARPEDTISVGYTSGTTGLPKALAFAHDEPLRYADVFLRTLPMDESERILCPLQFHYGDPLWLLLASVLRHTPLIVMRKFSVSRFWEVASRFDVTRLLSIGAIPALLLSAEPSPGERAHRIALAVAVGVPRAQHAELVARFGFPWLEYYGMSETCVAIALPRAYADRYVGTGALGIPVPETRVRLVDPEGAVLTGVAAGELEVSGPWVPFRGYLGDSGATDEILHDGWIRTGDLMSRDEDGVYYFEGRSKELIRRGGENIAPAQIEDVLRMHPAVVDAAVVPVPDPVRDEEVKAYVQIRTDMTPGELADHCAVHLAPHKVPRYIELRFEPFSLTPSQRIRKEELKVDGVHRIEGAWDRLAATPSGAKDG
jgi:carnitine-CoA ligase